MKIINKQTSTYIVILGIAQDGGKPHAGCVGKCCQSAWTNIKQREFSSCIAIIDQKIKKRWLIDATPDFKFQLRLVDDIFATEEFLGINGIFLTHGHIGHYTGLLQLDKSVINSKNVSVFVMPKMKKFIYSNQPWKNLVEEKNIILKDLESDKEIQLESGIFIKPFLIPHRDELSETVGYQIRGTNKKVLYISDINNWEDWNKKIENEIANVDIAFLDGTFFDKDEIFGRDLKKVSHPTIMETMQKLKNLNINEKHKIYFIHLNHTNPAINKDSEERKFIIKNGFNVSSMGDKICI